jgi:ketosteroid isomerase-like protein
VDDILPGLREALEAMNRGDVEPAVALLDPDVDWRGRPRGHLWWRQAPSCHGPEQARRNLKLQVDKGQARPGVKEFALEQVAQVGDCLVVGGRWTMADGSREVAGRFSQVLRVRGGLIVDIQGCTSRRAAMTYARRAA